MLEAVDLRVEYRTNPVNVFTAKPRFSWKIQSDKRNLLQAGYNIEVAEDSGFARPVWNSGNVSSGESHLVEYGGTQLKSSSCYYWRLKVMGNQGEESPWSETAVFQTTLLSNSEWQAAFISAEDETSDGMGSCAYLLRREFSAPGKIKRAKLYASAKGMFIAYINGERVGDDVLSPGWTEYRQRILFQTYDITPAITAGVNALGFILGPGWYKGDLPGWMGRKNSYGVRTAVIAQICIEYEDGRTEVIASDATWKCDKAPVIYSELYHGEIYDARMEQEGWNRSGFNDKSWKPVNIESTDLSVLKPHDGVPVKEKEVFKPVSMFKTPRGDTVIDFGQNISGWVMFKVRGKAGDRVKIRHTEVLDAQGNFYTENLRGAKQCMEYILSGKGEEKFNTLFTFQGFQYIAVDEWPGNAAIENFEARAIYSDIRPTGEFSCSHEKLNKFVSNVRWSMRDNFVDIPTDCPQRDERLGWTGDAHVFMSAANYLMETAPFFKKWLRDLAIAQLKDGRVPHVVPDVLNDKVDRSDENAQSESAATGWADVAVGAPWSLYSAFADKGILEEQYPSMKKWVDYIYKVSQEGTLFNVGFHFGDWVALDASEGSSFGATPTDLCATAFYANSADILSKAAAVLGKKDDAEKYADLRKKIGQAYRDEFFSPNGRLVARTQTAHILSLAFNLSPAEFKERTVRTLVELIGEKGNHLTTGFLGTPFVLQVLTDNGHADLAYELMLKEDFPSWLYQVNKGATTIWEHWDGIKPDGSMWSPGMNSFNHYAYGSVCDWVFRVVGGIDTDRGKVGYRHILLKPVFACTQITWAKTSYESVYGNVALSWEKKDGSVTVNVTVPPNTSATLTLPGAKSGVINGVNFTAAANDAVCELGSGSYSFVYQTT